MIGPFEPIPGMADRPLEWEPTDEMAIAAEDLNRLVQVWDTAYRGFSIPLRIDWTLTHDEATDTGPYDQYRSAS